MRGARNYALGSAAHLFEFGHEIGFCVQPTGGVHNYVLRVAGAGCLQRVIQNSSGISTWFGSDHLSSRALSPDFELINGSGAKRISRAQQHGFAVGTEHLRQLAYGGRLSSPIYADDQD